MGNRSHSKVDKLPEELRDAINKAIVDKVMTYKELTLFINQRVEDKRLGEEYKVSQSSVERYGKQFSNKLNRITVAREQAKAIIDTSVGLKTEMAEATTTVAFQLLMDMLINTDESQVDKNTIQAIKALASLERSTVSRESLKMKYDEGVSEATEKIMDGIKKELEHHPEIQAQMIKMVKAAEGDLRKQSA